MDREAYVVDLMGWQQSELDGVITFSYPCKEDAQGQKEYGFLLQDDRSADFIGWDGMFLVLEREQDKKSEEVQKEDEKQEIKVFAYVQEVTLHQTKEKCLKFQTFFSKAQKKVILEVYFSEFSVELSKENIWNFVKRFSFFIPAGYRIVEAVVRRRMQIYIDMPVKGQAAESGKLVCYNGLVCNCTREYLTVSANQQFLGWESMKAEVLLEDETGIREAKNGVFLNI